MRRVMIIVIVFSLLLSGCMSTLLNTSDTFAEREPTNFKEWKIPGTFVPQDIFVVGLGDSLTEGVGDEYKRGGYFGRLTEAMSSWKGVKEVKMDNLAKKGRRSDQLLEHLEDSDTQVYLKNADVIFITIGGNDIMKIVKRDLFDLKVKPFYDELEQYSSRIDEVFGIIRALNNDAIIVVGGLYNPLSNVIEETTEFEDILASWNNAIEARTVLDDKSCFVPVRDLFNSNENMVYHTDFFHPNAKGYEEMASRYLESIKKCGLLELSDGKLDM